MNTADIILAAVEQSIGRLRYDDFTPLPCGDPNCATIGYLLKTGDGTTRSVSEFTGYSQPTGDWFALIAPIGIILGRVGCLLHGCCLGQECGPHGWTLHDARGIDRWPAVPFEIGINVAALVTVFTLRKRGTLPGQHFHLYLIGYGLFRFGHEFLRATPRIGTGLTGYQIAALAVAGLGIGGFLRRRAGAGLRRSEGG